MQASGPGSDAGARPALRVLAAGLGVSLQDQGRPHAAAMGVPASGAVDERLLGAAQALLGQASDGAALEILVAGPTLEVMHQPVRLAWVGDLTVKVRRLSQDGSGHLGSEAVLGSWRSATLWPGDQLVLGAPRRGPAYLAVQSGWAVQPMLGSRSSYPRARLGGLAGRPFAVGDVWPVGSADPTPDAPQTLAPPWETSDDGVLRVLLGPHPLVSSGLTDELNPSQPLLECAHFEVDRRSDRMGWRLTPCGDDEARREGGGGQVPPWRPVPEVIQSQAVMPGVIQWPPDGKPIILGPDAQTVGGYPIVGVVIQADRPKLARQQPGQIVRFQVIDRRQAFEASTALAADWVKWRAQIRKDAPLAPRTEDLFAHNLVSGVWGADEADGPDDLADPMHEELSP
jgi:5-oxoprolinase (ATP-hydrolysing) subunit C